MVWLCRVDILDNIGLGLPDFTTASFDVVATFETEHPYLNGRYTVLNINCNMTHNVAFLILDFKTERDYDFVTLTDRIDNDEILRKFQKSVYNYSDII